MADIQFKAILSFPHLFVARKADDTSAPKFSATGLLHKDDPQLPMVYQAFEDLKAAFPGGWKDTHKCALRPSAEFPDYWEVRSSASEAQKPHVVGMDRQPIIDSSMVYAGAEAWLSINPYKYDKPMSKGVTAGLNGVLITGVEGALGRLDSRPSVDEMFADVPGAGVPAPTGSGPAPTPALNKPAAPAPTPPKPAAPAPTPPKPAAPAPPAPAPEPKMTAHATTTYKAYKDVGWEDAQLIAQGYMEA